MAKLIKILSVYCVLILFTGGCATSGSGEKNPTVNKFTESMSLMPSSFEEECLKLSPSQTLDYKFTSSGAIDFNIHNHGKKGRTYVVHKDGISEWEGVVDPAKLGDGYDKNRPQFCMFWKNNSDKQVKVSLEYTVTSR